MVFRKSNGYEETGGTSLSWLWCLLFGPLFFLMKGCYRHAILSIIAVPLTGGLSLLIYPWFAAGIVNRTYLRDGTWFPVNDVRDFLANAART
jgi:hypothetical protein